MESIIRLLNRFCLPYDREFKRPNSRIIKWVRGHVANWRINPWKSCFLSPGVISNRRIISKLITIPIDLPESGAPYTFLHLL